MGHVLYRRAQTWKYQILDLESGLKSKTSFR